MENRKKSPRITINKVYTRTGDRGNTKLVGGQVRKKSDIRVNAYGTVDELISLIGGCIEIMEKEHSSVQLRTVLRTSLIRVQHELFNLGTTVATLPEDIDPGMPHINPRDIIRLEKEIDDFNESLPTLHSFVLPGGSEANVWFHLARTVCRRAERSCVTLMLKESLDELVIQYLNRLSDALFVWSRWINQSMNYPERHWEPFDKSTD